MTQTLSNKPLKSRQNDHTVFLTDSAIKRLLELCSQNNTPFRITVDSGGCSGFQYKFNLDAQSFPDDITFTYNSIEIVTDPVSMPFLENITIDFVENLMGAAFALKNPNASQSCGCGNSFAI